MTTKSTVITGTGEAGSTATVTFPDGTTPTGTESEADRNAVKIPDNLESKSG
ncbi:hypothetical protein [Staphylococcus felis]|uniref:hypothetical protein n=1 Tax=Staphylococcus felis TaxID=46127 RepID=UPI0015F25FB7|nr:hypothetical protein [Staphylococcus felis]